MSDKNSIVARVESYLGHSGNIKAEGMAAISERAVIVRDNYHETDVYFDSASYRVVCEKCWDGEGGMFTPVLREIGLGVLPGVGRAPRVNSYEEALEFARQHLEPLVEEARYFERPKPVK